MASPSEIAHGLPETLPEDFSDWDGGSSSAPAPRSSGAPDASHSFGAAPRPPARSADRDAFLSPVAVRPRDPRSPMSTPVFAEDVAYLQRDKLMSRVADTASHTVHEKQKIVDALVDRMPGPAPHRRESVAVNRDLMAPGTSFTAVAREARAAFKPQVVDRPFQAFEPVDDLDEPAKSKKWMIVPAICSVPVLLLLVFFVSTHRPGNSPTLRPLDQPTTAVADTQPQPDSPASSRSKSLTQSKPSAAAKNPSADTTPGSDNKADNPTDAQTEMMKDQLAAPTRVPRTSSAPVAENAPAASIGTEGLSGSGSMGNVLNSQPASARVTHPEAFAISAGVATGRLIDSRPPLYPQVAKTARVSGTVGLVATISRTGAITNLRVVSGPVMLRQAAYDAVRTWRYKPFELNNEPIDVQTSINVIFSLDETRR